MEEHDDKRSEGGNAVLSAMIHKRLVRAHLLSFLIFLLVVSSCDRICLSLCQTLPSAFSLMAQVFVRSTSASSSDETSERESKSPLGVEIGGERMDLIVAVSDKFI